MKKILMLGTGGTISCVPTENGFVPGLDAKALASMVPGLADLAELECLTISDLDSTNVGPEHWLKMVQALKENYAKYDGFVITHGTDTMAYTAAALSQLVHNCQKPVVITGSQLTMSEEGTDAKNNIYLSVQTAASDMQGICLAFGDRVIHGLKAKKMCTENLNGFWSINTAPLADVVDGQLLCHSKIGAAYGEGEFSITTKLETKVAAVKITPGLPSDIIDFYVKQGYKGLVLESYGAGGIPNDTNNWLPAIEGALKAGVRIICASQCLYDGVHLDRYPMGIMACKLGVESGGLATVEALVTKLMVELA